MSLASGLLLLLVLGLLVYDAATLRGRGRRMLWLEAAAFAAGGFFIARPDAATRFAHAVGIGRGVDLLLYPIVIWLVRESLVSRHRRWEERERLTQVVRALAMAKAERTAPAAPSPPSGA